MGGTMVATEWPLTRASVRRRHTDDPDAPPPPAVDDPAFVRLREQRARVPAVIQRVGRTAWYARIDTSRARETVASRAYHKMGEIVESCALPYPATSLHLCEAPGGFVQWLGDHHPTPDAWRWEALSLPSGPEFRCDLLRMDRGRTLAADVQDESECRAIHASASVDLVTADGAVEMDHDHLEEEHLTLLWAQTLVAMHALRPGGTFVVKFFEGGLRATRLFVAHMSNAFRHVSVIKPVSSRSTNSERYLVCRHFVSSVARDDDAVVAPLWEREISEVLGAMADEQARELRRVIRSLS